MAGSICGEKITPGDDDDSRRAELARMLAENEDDWFRIKARSADRSGGSSPTVAAGGDEEVLQFEPAKINTTLMDTPGLSLVVPNEVQELRAEKEQLNIELDQVKKQLASKTLAHDEALTQIKLQGEQLETKRLAHEEALQQVSNLQDNVLARDAIKEASDYKIKQLTGGTSFMDRLDRLYNEKDKDKDQIQRLLEERLSLCEDLRRKGETTTQLQKQVFQFKKQLGSLQLQLGSRKAVESQLIDKCAEVDSLKYTLANLNTQKGAQSVGLSTVRTELKDALNANQTQSKAITALEPHVAARCDKQKMWELKRDIAFYITHLDLANNRCRVFSCAHVSLFSLPKRNKSTLQRDARVIAGEFFRDWANDKQFMDQYHFQRQYVIDHHRAHERSASGRGAHSGTIKNILTQVDGGRNVSLEYN
ncbi:uncharacterized protein N0V89_001302 [Didymosphaeria variabile]|uniref:Uncharacterized protein n=1 Tax=Didymosphaeria variabile TaxID=1932322 RepID=A0A9W8XY56_9PLEO|nr:uncharacterized protein N0V89_001302 [Didymosphaeria variabile]KAJ4360735.1 hypothetical protein N0V89_001302 [Didymosphaeria variabile]